MNERLNNYEMSAIGMKKERKKMNERRENFFFLFSCFAFYCSRRERGEREKEDLNQHPSFFINAEIETKA